MASIALQEKRRGALQAANILPWLGLGLIITILGIASGGLLFSAYNFKSIIRDVTPLFIVSMGAVFIYSLSAMDISIGSVAACCGLFAILTMNRTGSVWLGVLVSIVISTGVAVTIGTISVTMRLMPIMTSMCFMLIGRGVVTRVTTDIGGTAVKTVADVSIFKNTTFQIVVMAIVAIIWGSIYCYTRIGKNAKAIGANRVCAAQSGVNTVRFFVLPYLMLGLAVGLASIFMLSTTASVSRTTGNGFEMDVMVALILGGMPLAGGMRSRISSAVIGPFSYVVLKNGLLLTSFISINQVDMVKAAIFFIIVCITCRRKGNVLPI